MSEGRRVKGRDAPDVDPTLEGAHAHAHLSAAELSAAGPHGGVRVLLLSLVIAIGLGTVVGLVELWPEHGSAHRIPFLAEGAAQYDAAVVKVGDPCPVLEGSAEQGGQSTMPEGCDGLVVRPLSGPDRGHTETIQAGPEAVRAGLRPGDTVAVVKLPSGTGDAVYGYLGVQRGRPLLWIVLVAFVVVIAVARLRGLLALVGLGIAAVVVWRFMLPSLLEGRSGLAVALVGSVAIMYAVLYLAHGPSLRTTVALVGTILGIGVTAALGIWGISSARLSGVEGDASQALLVNAPDLRFRDVLICAVIVAGLGVLNDVTITQASAVWELRLAAPTASRWELFQRGMRIGRDHIASTIYTIAFTYTGTALALLMLVSLFDRPLADLLLDPGVAAEVVRTLASGVGLVLAVPLTTALAAGAVRPALRS